MKVNIFFVYKAAFLIVKSVYFGQSDYLLYWCIQADYASVTSPKSQWLDPWKTCPLCIFNTKQQRSLFIWDIQAPRFGGHLSQSVHNSCGHRRGLLLITQWLLTSASERHHHYYSHFIGSSKSREREELRGGWWGSAVCLNMCKEHGEHFGNSPNDNHTSLCCVAMSLILSNLSDEN